MYRVTGADCAVNLLIDLEHLTFCDSTGVSALICNMQTDQSCRWLSFSGLPFFRSYTGL
jgi:hypothetical protein